MKISVDAGGLCTINRYGNYVVTANLLKALSLYDGQNSYTAYTFCDPSAKLSHIHFVKLRPTVGWMKLAVAVAEITNNHDYFLALNSALPSISRSKIISFLHGLSFLHFPQYYRDSYYQLKVQLEQSLNRSQYVIVSSTRVQKELADNYSQFLDKIKVLPFGLAFDLQSQLKTFADRHIEPYFVFVGMNHPIKNIAFIVDSFNEFISDKRFSQYQLFLVGPHDSFKSKNIRVIRGISRKQLQSIYQQATAYLSASFYESFNLPVLEALSQNCPVIGLSSAIIPELEPYTSIASDKEEFIQLMKELVADATIVDQSKLSKQFSWQSYVQELIKLY